MQNTQKSVSKFGRGEAPSPKFFDKIRQHFFCRYANLTDKGGDFRHLEGAGCLRKLPVGDAECVGFPIHYYLLVETLENDTEMYGVSVEYRTERAEIPAITVFRRRAEALAELLRRGGVTPVAARDVTEDWLLV